MTSGEQLSAPQPRPTPNEASYVRVSVPRCSSTTHRGRVCHPMGAPTVAAPVSLSAPWRSSSRGRCKRGGHGAPSSYLIPIEVESRSRFARSLLQPTARTLAEERRENRVLVAPLPRATRGPLRKKVKLPKRAHQAVTATEPARARREADNMGPTCRRRG